MRTGFARCAGATWARPWHGPAPTGWRGASGVPARPSSTTPRARVPSSAPRSGSCLSCASRTSFRVRLESARRRLRATVHWSTTSWSLEQSARCTSATHRRRRQPLRLRSPGWSPTRWRRASDAHLRRVRLPLPVHGRGRGALVSRARRAALRGGSRRHVHHTPAVAARPSARVARCARRRRRDANVALHRERTPTHSAAGRVRPWHAAAPLGRPALRRRAHGVISVLFGPGGSCREAVQAVPPGHRLARGLDARLLGRVPRPARADRLGGAEAVRAPRPPRVLLLAPPRPTAPSGGLPRRARDSRGAIRVALAPAAAATRADPAA